MEERCPVCKCPVGAHPMRGGKRRLCNGEEVPERKEK